MPNKPQGTVLPGSRRAATPEHRYLTQSNVSGTLLRGVSSGGGSGVATHVVSPRGNTRPVTAPRIQGLGGSGSVSPQRSKNQQQVRVKTPRRRDNGGNSGFAASPRGTTISTLLPPRRMSSLSSTCVADDRGGEFCDSGSGRQGTGVFEPVQISELHFSRGYTSHKSHWLKKALENLGGTWVRDGKITNSQLVSQEFEEKMGILYDLAMAKKHDAIDRLVTEELEVEKGKLSRKKKKSSSSGRSSAKSSTPPPLAVHHNFPFAEHLSGAVKESMSESLLRIMMRGDDDALLKSKDRGDGVQKKEKSKKRDEHSSSSNSFEKSLRKRSLVQCFVCDGKLVVGTKDKMLSVGGSFVNKFGESSSSRARRSGSESEKRYFRATANLMGFLPHEVNIRYSKSSRQLIVSGSRSKRGADNARQVRETIEVPKDVDVFTCLVVLRTTRGSLIFEQVEQDF